MSDSLQHPTPTSAASIDPETGAVDPLLVQYERACAEMQLAGRKLHRQMQEYQSVLDEVARLEATGTSDAREKLKRLETLVESEAFQRDEREIRRMTAALAHTIERMRADAPVPLDDTSTSPAKRAPAAVRRVCA
ncbi:hypothetical protein PHO31112_02382 [Pandoraea horticolens]|uniref:Uncharacterized protein n=1 Tax=Pandoraea horticolens TaxID=2508298 RepID=A0A5E4V1K4_9BURK|nr:hypothetical protein [Pandoraea horticolens]VVE06162.1 hypothetical protein PHO31112_02382 [Pandoraea horticolens]